MTHNNGLDPNDWAALRALGHRMLDDTFDHLQQLRDGPVWRPMPAETRAHWQQALPRAPGDLAEAYREFQAMVQPYSVGNLHPGFMGWVHGGGTAVGMLAEMLAGGLNANCGGRDHAPILVERQVIAWAAEIMGMPPETAGLLVTGTSTANLIGVLVARRAALGAPVRERGVGGTRLTAYTSAAAHGCVKQAMDMAGLGTKALRMIPVDAAFRLDCDALAARVAADRAAGSQPFLVVGTAGTVDTGACDDLARLAAFCQAEGLWFHVDGAFGALARLSPEHAHLVTGLERADSVAFDFHKWAQVPYDAGCILVRDPARQMDAFAQTAEYLRRETRGLAGGSPWPCDLGPDLSRAFRALKVWLTLRCFGADRLGEVVAHSCAVARHLAERVRREPALELLAPVPLNIVCFRVRGRDDAFTAGLVADVQEAGAFAPSTTRIAGVLAIRAAIVNHRTELGDADGLVDDILRLIGDHPAPHRQSVSPGSAVPQINRGPR